MITGKELAEKTRPLVKEVDIHQLKEVMAHDENAVVIDIRESVERSVGYIVNTIHIPRGVLEMKIAEHDDIVSRFPTLEALGEQPIYLICRSSGRSVLSALALDKMGFKKVYSVAGGIMAWEDAGYDYHVVY
ncbi:MAG: rhodanese-like domain-containing protein [Psychromonas sp.]|nr:rhodanese-like domain-containing protein [Psychromonas sp.]